MYTTLGALSGAFGGSNGAQSGVESRISTLTTPLNGLAMVSPPVGFAAVLQPTRSGADISLRRGRDTHHLTDPDRLRRRLRAPRPARHHVGNGACRRGLRGRHVGSRMAPHRDRELRGGADHGAGPRVPAV